VVVTTRAGRVESPPEPPADGTDRTAPPPGTLDTTLDIEEAADVLRDGQRVPIVAIGASAGGLEAFTELLHVLPVDTGMAFVLVQHLSPDYQSMLRTLMSKATSMPVSEVTEGVYVEPNHVYVIPPNKTMGIRDGVLHLVPRPELGSHMPIDAFLESLAIDNKSQSIAVILSGTASDGARGLKAIKAEGGITMVQDPQTARFDGMPKAAIAGGAVDFVVPLDQIGPELGKLARHSYLVRSRHDEAAELMNGENEHIRRIFALVRSATGVDFSLYKRATINRRMRRRMLLHRIERLPEYLRMLQSDPTEIEKLCRDVFIHVTGFFRDPELFEALKTTIFADILNQHADHTPIRIWVAACSTGEEAYSYAIALLEAIGTDSRALPVQIFATDISAESIERARSGSYPESIASDVSPERLRRFFQRAEGGYRINKSIRDMCVFAKQDVTKDPPFSKLDLVSCRNLLIYLGPMLQKRVLSVIHYALRPTGHLVLGNSETIGSLSDLFGLVDKRHKIYVRKSTVVRNSMEFRTEQLVDRTPPPKHLGSSTRGTDLQDHVDRIILDDYAPAGVVVNQDLQIIQVRGDTGNYLQPARGEATLNILKMARPGLMIDLRAAIQTAHNRNIVVRKAGLRVRQNGHFGKVDLEVVPLAVPGADKHLLVLFRDGHGGAGAKQEPAPKPERLTKEVRSRQRLEQELTATRDYLQSIIQDQEATNEELQSANEEILSSNEELQSTNEELETAKEELQSTNEELNTVNEELHTTNQELTTVNSDLTNLLASVQIPIIMVSNDLRIRRFTPLVEKLFNVIPRDVDRPLGDFKLNLQLQNLTDLVTTAIDTVTVRELEVQDLEGRWYSMRIRPYKNIDNRIDGAVITLFDIDAMRKNVLVSDISERLIAAMTRVASEPILILDRNQIVLDASRAFYRQFELSPQESKGRKLYDIAGGAWNVPRVRVLVEELLAGEAFVEDYAVELDGTQPAAWTLNASTIGNLGDKGRLTIITCRPIGEGSPHP